MKKFSIVFMSIGVLILLLFAVLSLAAEDSPIELLMILFGIGFSFFLIGFFIYRSVWKSDRLVEKLRKFGRKIEVPNNCIQIKKMNYSNSLNWIVIATWNESNNVKKINFTSEEIGFDPTEYIENKNLSVYVDWQDDSAYFMDLSFLPQLARLK